MLMKVTIRAILLALASTLSIAANARADAPKHVDIPAGDLSQALLLLSQQYGADLVYRPEQVHGLKTHGANGEFTGPFTGPNQDIAATSAFIRINLSNN